MLSVKAKLIKEVSSDATQHNLEESHHCHGESRWDLNNREQNTNVCAPDDGNIVDRTIAPASKNRDCKPCDRNWDKKSYAHIRNAVVQYGKKSQLSGRIGPL